MRERLTCIICGKVFPRGQGIVIERANILLVFHSKKCASKFLRLFIERIPEREFKRVSRELLSELEELRRKKIATKQI